ncbi:MAG: nucleotidyltransferase domain-containing protein [Candidatus Woesearchaeota archaeon]
MYPKRNNVFDVISLFRTDYRKRFYLREISRLTKMPLKTAQNVLATLEKETLLRSSLEGKNKYFALNLENVQAKSMLLQAEIYQTIRFLEHYGFFKTFLKAINTNLLIVVFGSYAKMTSTKDSDVDILIVQEPSTKQVQAFQLLPVNIHKVAMQQGTLVKAIRQNEPLIKEIEESHVILNNHSLYVNLMWDHYAR